MNTIMRKMTGSAGAFTFKTVEGRTIVSEKATIVKNTRTSGQQKQRMKWGNMVQMYKGISPLLNSGFENKNAGVSDYNMFIKVNSQITPVYLTKAEVTSSACVVAPYKITQGSLPTIETTGEGANRVTGIALGTLSIKDSTTVSEFSNAVVQNNSNFDYGDQLSFFSVLQFVNATTGIPYAQFKAWSVTLDKESNTPLWSLVNKAGFASKNGYLAHGADEGNGAYCWVHSRNKNGKVKVSSQALLDNNAILASYTSQDAYYEAVNTYGGESDVFLSPDGSSVTRSSASGGSSTPSGGGTSGGDDEGGSF